jgi:carboxylesterase type B
MLALRLLLLISSIALALSCDHLLQTHSGPVCGSQLPSGATNFLGIPYAAPPIGALRFASPVDPQPWTDIRDASVYATPPPSKTNRKL